MSVTLTEYCETSQSKFAEALRVALQHAVFCGSDDLEFVEVNDGVRAYISIMYDLSMFDMKHLLDAFRDFYWKILPSSDTYEFRVVIHLKSNKI